MFGRARRRQAEPAEFPAEWRIVLRRRWPLWSQLSSAERDRLEQLTLVLLDQFSFEASNEFELTDEMRVLVAAQAALLVLELGVDAYRKVRTVIVHPATMVVKGARRTGSGGLMTDAPTRIDGQAHYRGPILLAWDSVVYDARHPLRGLNVVFHEFAHQLDMLDGVVDGTPPMDDGARERWTEVCTAEYET
ncbi:MAG: zinc-dependent peptidase, partial [Actinomycetota bacterium]|nr:zinc-dependent peptidase [Actinomycetota bacterium]